MKNIKALFATLLIATGLVMTPISQAQAHDNALRTFATILGVGMVASAIAHPTYIQSQPQIIQPLPQGYYVQPQQYYAPPPVNYQQQGYYAPPVTYVQPQPVYYSNPEVVYYHEHHHRHYDYDRYNNRY